MNETSVRRVCGQTVKTRLLDNGLTVCLFEKPGWNKKFALYATNFGAVDSVFTDSSGSTVRTPAGVAHFLEHKVFEQKDGNALQFFASTGASPNAFTSQTMTAYHFSCTDRFYENLDYLVKFVNNPYFTDENVSKEQGIIGQEIGMTDDSPDFRVYMGLFELLFPDHTISTSITGTVESIGRITPSVLYSCHRAFYSPSNMALIVSADADFDRICEIAASRTPESSSAPTSRDYSTGVSYRGSAKKTVRMAVSQPVFMSGFRGMPDPSGSWRGTMLASLAADYLCGSSSPLYSSLYADGLIADDFAGEYVSFPGGGALIFGGESRSPDDVMARITEEAANTDSSFDIARFERLKKASIGMMFRYFDVPAALCRKQASALFAGSDFVNFMSDYESICADDIKRYIIDNVREENMGMFTASPV